MVAGLLPRKQLLPKKIYAQKVAFVYDDVQVDANSIYAGGKFDFVLRHGFIAIAGPSVLPNAGPQVARVVTYRYTLTGADDLRPDVQGRLAVRWDGTTGTVHPVANMWNQVDVVFDTRQPGDRVVKVRCSMRMACLRLRRST
jgi:hypothetical protein